MVVGRPRWWALATCLAAVAAALSPAPVQSQDSCVDCHEGLRDPRLRNAVTDLRASVHAEADLGCSSCHGGNPDVSTVQAHDRSRGFQSRIEAASMPETCGSCHADEERFAGEDHLPTDQLAGYLESVHGRAFVEGNTKAAACWDCHGHHRVLPPDDPESTVHPSHVVETCARCHGSEAIMSGSELPTDQARQWRRSAHGQAHAEWVAAGNGAGDGDEHPPACIDCHGEHEVDAGEEAVSACSGCHEGAWEAFEASPHREAFARKGFLPCVECHGSHEIAPADPTLVGLDRDAACQRCHRAGQEMADTIRELAEAQLEAETAAQRARDSLEGDRSEEDEALLHSLDDHAHELRMAIHGLDRERIAEATAELEATANAVLGRAPEVKQRDERQERLRVVIIGGTASVAVALLGLVMWARRRSM